VLFRSAVDEFGMAQAVELRDKVRFVVGVQWHPEDMPDRRLFEALVAAAAAHRASVSARPASVSAS